MPNNRVILCGNVNTNHLPWDDQRPIKFRTSGPHWNIRPGLPKVHQSLLQNIPERFCDLLEIATYVYVADQVATRGGEGVDEVGENWYRNMFFRIPVRDPEFWNSTNVTEILSQTLHFLSDDIYCFDFVPLIKPSQLERYFDFGDRLNSLPHDPNLVMLFSGGLDSLAGAIHESIVNSRKIVMVMHRSTDKFTKRHGQLYNQLTQKSKHQPLLFPVKINKKKNLNHEYTQRSRSFLYVTLGAIFSEMFGLSDVRFYENGVISMNLPVATQAVGTRSTRTTHPQVLNGFTKLISLVADRQITVHNPFMWKTKKDIVEIIKNAGCSDMIADSISCAHASWGVSKGKTHCGICSQCIDRRFAILSSGLENYDPGDLYDRDLLIDPRSDVEHKLMISSYVGTAEEITKMRTPTEFFAAFGMASRAFEYFSDRSADTVAQDIYQLYKRHATDVVDVIGNSVASHAKGIVARKYDPACLIRLVSDSGDLDQKTVSKQIVEAPLRENAFKKKGNAWIVRFAGGDEFIVTPCKGVAYIHMLLSCPNTQIRATEMYKNLADNPQEYQLGDAGEILPAETLQNYYAMLDELENIDLPKAEADGDLVRKDELIELKTWLESEIKRTGIKGKRRDKSDRNRIRNNVCNAITNVIKKQIEPYDPRMAAYFQKPRLTKGYELCYMPDDDLEWDLE